MGEGGEYNNSTPGKHEEMAEEAEKEEEEEAEDRVERKARSEDTVGTRKEQMVLKRKKGIDCRSKDKEDNN